MVVKNMPVELIFRELNLEEDSIYLVNVKTTENNIEHESVLFTGFKTGGYCVVYHNSYTTPVELRKIYSITTIKKLK